MYTLSNLFVPMNLAKFKPTSCEIGISFKRKTNVCLFDCSTLPINTLYFILYNYILNESMKGCDLVGMFSMVFFNVSSLVFLLDY